MSGMGPRGGLIVVEGPDAAGKTTLCRALCEAYEQSTGTPALYMHATYWKNIWPLQAGILRYASKVCRDRLVVVDRLWQSENIYARVMRQGTDLGGTTRAFHRQVAWLGGCYVYCVSDPDSIVERWKKTRGDRHELVERVEQMRDIACRYLDLWAGNILRPHDGDYCEQLANAGGVGLHPGVTRYDIADHPGKPRPDFVKRLLREAAGRVVRYRGLSWAGATGHPEGRVLLVGDRANNPRPTPPFIANVNSSRFLNDALHALRVDERHLTLANAHDLSDLELVQTSGRKRVIALGGRAAERLRKLEVPVAAVVPHPAYAKRFLGQNAGRTYRAELEQAIYPTERKS